MNTVKKVDLKIIKNRHKPLCMTQAGVLTYSRGNIYLLNSDTYYAKRISSITSSFTRKILSRFRILERIFRLEPRVAIELSEDHILFSCQGKIYSLNINSGDILEESTFQRGMNNPLSIVIINGIKGFNDCVAYGEYIGNMKKGPVAIYTRSLTENDWKKAFEFKSNTVTHIHNVIPDPYRNCVYILTGDSDSESGIWIAQNNFNEVKPLFIGSQIYRSCCAFALPEGILYATDTSLEQNCIFLLKYTDSGWLSEKIAEISGSCIYGAKFGDKYAFSTTVEPDSSVSGLRYRLSYRLGSGIKGWHSEVYIGNLETGFIKIASLRKDIFPMWLCQFGNVLFCNGCKEDELLAYPVAVNKYDGKLISINFGEH